MPDEIRAISFLAKLCTLVGIQPTGSSDGTWGNLAKSYMAETLIDREVNVLFKVSNFNFLKRII